MSALSSPSLRTLQTSQLMCRSWNTLARCAYGNPIGISTACLRGPASSDLSGFSKGTVDKALGSALRLDVKKAQGQMLRYRAGRFSFPKQLILKACDVYPDRGNRVRLRALVLLLRYSGLRIRDAATLSRSRIQGDKLFLFTAKTGTLVYCPLPPFLIDALNVIPERTEYFSGRETQPPKPLRAFGRKV
jgi:integrase